MTEQHECWRDAQLLLTIKDGQRVHWTADCTCGIHEEGDDDLPLKYMMPWEITAGATFGGMMAAIAVAGKPPTPGVRILPREAPDGL